MPKRPATTKRRRGTRARLSLDAWFGTLSRYAGLTLLIYAVSIDRLHNPALLPAATGLMFLKTVSGGGDSK